MNKQFFLFCITTSLLIIACSKEEKSERFRFLTTPVWASDSIVANKAEPAGTWAFLKRFKGDAKFNEDGTGYFGKFKGQWRLNQDETEITIITDSLPLPIITDIVLLTSRDLKIATSVTNPLNPTESADIRMTFKAK
jgi:hypothetical protein